MRKSAAAQGNAPRAAAWIAAAFSAAGWFKNGTEGAAYAALADMQQLLPSVLAIAAASLLYVAVADLIPSLHRRAEPLETLKQMLWIALGIAIIGGAHLMLEPR